MAEKKTTTKKIKEEKVAAAVPVEEPKAVKAETPKKAKKNALSCDVYDMAGRVVGSVDLPEALFAAKVNKVLMTQAVRVYLANQRQGTHSTKTRGEVTGSTRKIYRQKGTGRARHGGVRAPIFVHGGIAHGPKPVDHSLALSKNMRRAALKSALTAKAIAAEIRVVAKMGEIEPKTKTVVGMLKALDTSKKKVLLVMPSHIEKVYKAARNIEDVKVTAADRLNTYEVLNNNMIIFMQEAIDALKTKEKNV